MTKEEKQQKKAQRKKLREKRREERKERCQKFWTLIKQALQSFFNVNDSVAEGEQTQKKHSTYLDVFPDADVKEMIALGNRNDTWDVNGEKLGYIVYVDSKNRLAARVMNADNGTPEERVKMEKNIALVRLTDTFPINVLSDEEKICFKKILGIAHVSILEGAYDNVPSIRKNAIEYASCRNREQTRKTILSTATWITGITLLIAFFIYGFLPQCKECLPSCDWMDCVYDFTSSKIIFAMLMGIIGSYVSLWLRYRRLGILSYGTKWAIRRETFYRMFVGAIFALIAVLCVKSGLLFTSWATNLITMGIVGFVAGFSERLIPNLIEKIVKNENNDKDGKKPEDVFLADTELAPGSTDE